MDDVTKKRTKKFMSNGNLRLVILLVMFALTIAGTLVAVTLSHADNKASADSAHEKVDAVEGKQIEVNKRFDERFDRVDERFDRSAIRQMRIEDKQDKVLDILRDR